MAARGRQRLSLLRARRRMAWGGEARRPGTHLQSMTEEQLMRLRARALSQKLCSVKPKQMRQELMVRLNLSRKQSKK